AVVDVHVAVCRLVAYSHAVPPHLHSFPTRRSSDLVYRITVGWILSTLLAVPIGILMGNFRLFEGLFEPFVDLVRYMPAVAFVPLTILWLGVGDTQKFAILFIGVFFQEVLLIMDNVKTVPRDMIQVSYTFGLSRGEIL